MYTVQEVIDQLMKIEDKTQILHVNIPPNPARQSEVTPKFEINNGIDLEGHWGKLIIYPFF